MFYVGIKLDDRAPIPEEEIELIPCEQFKLPPQGTSGEKEFDLLCHLEVEPAKDEKKKEGDEDEEEEEEEDETQEPEQKYKKTVPRI